MSDSLQPHVPQHARPPSPSPTPRVYSNMSIESVMPSNHLILCPPLLLLPSIFPSIRVFSNESVLCIRWPKYWSFSFSIRPSIEYSGLIFFRMDWLDLLAVRGTLKSLLQHHSSKASVLWCLAFFFFLIVQLSHQYMTTGKTIAVTIRTFVSRVMSLLFNTLSRFVSCLPAKKQLRSDFMVAVTVHSDFGAQEEEIGHYFHLSPSVCHVVIGPDGIILVFLIFSFKLALSLSSFTLIKKLFSSSLLSAIRVVSTAYLRLLMFLPAVLIPACNLSRISHDVLSI